VGSKESWGPREVLERLAPRLPPDLLDDAREVARRFEDGDDRARALIVIARQMQGASRAGAVDEALRAARTTSEDAGLTGPNVDRVSALLEVVDALDGPAREQVLAESVGLARGMSPDDSWRARTLADVAAHSPEPARSDLSR